uniref:Short-chain dehydrogenase/reductase 3 n=1 Tax=Culicoides sonorensis TaxID=179676 RepID=A0A336MF17_CULSO
MAEMLYESAWEHFYSLLIDLLIFFVKSIYFIGESIFLTLLPNKLRKLKDLSAIFVAAIKGTVDALHQEGYSCYSYEVDISNKDHVYEMAKRVRDEVGKVDILINNAGIVTCRTLLDLPDKAIENTYNVNILSHYWTVKSFLPEMIAQNRGHIVTVASVTGLMGTYGCTDYSATKFACVGFHESLFTELKTHGHDNVNLTLVCPYHISTNMFSGVRPRLLPCLEPKYVADSIVNAVQKNEVTCILPDSIRYAAPMKFFLPAKMCWEMMHRVMKGPESMMLFRVRGRATAG